MSETRARRRMRQAVESRGFNVLSMEFEHWSAGVEKGGMEGGWIVKTDRPFDPHTNYGNEAMGYSVEDTLADIDWTFRPSEPCDCYPEDRPRRHAAHTIKGDPQRPLHEPKCRWFIRYHLPWWPTEPTPDAHPASRESEQAAAGARSS